MRPTAFLGRLLPLGLATLLVACNLAGPAGGPTKPGPSKTVRPAGKSPTPSAKASAGAQPRLSLLEKPGAGTVLLGGQVNVEASYAFGAGGVLIGDAGSGLIGNSGGTLIGKVKLIGDAGSGLIGDAGSGLIGKVKLIGDAGSGLIANNGAAIAVGGVRIADGRILSNNGGSVIAEGSGNAVASLAGGQALALDDGTLLAGGQLIGDAGSGLIGDAGSGLVANNGGGLIGKVKFAIPEGPAPYRLAQVPAAAAGAEAVGVALPAAGMVVGVVSLATHQYLPLGVDAAGKPVYAVYSDANGRFTVHVPAAEKDNVLVVASTPGTRDPRGTYGYVATDRTAETAVDDLGRMVARYIRRTFTGRLAATIKSPALSLLLIEREGTFGGAMDQPGTAKGDLKVLIDLLIALGEETGVGPDTPDAVVNRKAQRLVDLALARMDLANLQINADDIGIWTDDVGPRPPRPVLETFRLGLTILLDGATKKLRAEPGFFSQEYVSTVINATAGGDAPPLKQDWTGRIKTPSDVGEFMMVEYFEAVRANGNAPTRRMYQIFHEARGDKDPEAQSFESLKVLSSTVSQTSIAFARVLARPELRDEVKRILAEPDPGVAP